MKKIFIPIIFLAMAFVFAGCSGSGLGVPEDASVVEEFQFTNQQGETFGSGDLKDKVWVVSFIFTNCETVCPPMTANMSKLQEKAKENGLEVEFVSFSVDPELDTPERLKQYGEQFQADFTNWNFLTGYSQTEIETFASKSFRALVQKPSSTDQVIHGTSFYLVNPNGYVIKSYSGLENTPYDQIISDIKSFQ